MVLRAIQPALSCPTLSTVVSATDCTASPHQSPWQWPNHNSITLNSEELWVILVPRPPHLQFLLLKWLQPGHLPCTPHQGPPNNLYCKHKNSRWTRATTRSVSLLCMYHSLPRTFFVDFSITPSSDSQKRTYLHLLQTNWLCFGSNM